jgi:hypothetical protein
MALSSTCMLCGIFLVVRVFFCGKQSLPDLVFSDFDAQQVKADVTPTSVASDALRVLVRNTQVFRFFWAKEKASLRWLFLVFGAQKRTRTSTPYGTRT